MSKKDKDMFSEYGSNESVIISTDTPNWGEILENVRRKTFCCRECGSDKDVGNTYRSSKIQLYPPSESFPNGVYLDDVICEGPICKVCFEKVKK